MATDGEEPADTRHRSVREPEPEPEQRRTGAAWRRGFPESDHSAGPGRAGAGEGSGLAKQQASKKCESWPLCCYFSSGRNRIKKGI